MVQIFFQERLDMVKLKITGLARQKGVSLSPKGGSISEEVIIAPPFSQ